MHVMILAAGRGERMRPLTDRVPKPLLQVGGKALIEYHLDTVRRCGWRNVVINLSWRGAQLRDALGDGSRYGLDIAYSEEGEPPLETGGGIHRASPLLGRAPFVVINGDTFTDFDPTRLTLRPGALAQLALVANPAHHPNGDFHLDGGCITPAGGPRYTYSGTGMFHPDMFAGCTAGRFPLLPLLQEARAAGRLDGVVHAGRWVDVGTPERLAELDHSLGGGSPI